MAYPLLPGRLPRQGAPVSPATPTTPGAQFGQQFPKLQDFLRYLIAQGQGQGAFGPDFLRKALRRRALMNAASQRRGAGATASLYGLDPAQRRAALAQGDIGAGSQLAESLNQADLAGLSGYQDMIRSILGSERGQESQYLAEQRALHEQNRGGIGGFLGELAGTAVGAGAGPGGFLTSLLRRKSKTSSNYYPAGD